MIDKYPRTASIQRYIATCCRQAGTNHHLLIVGTGKEGLNSILRQLSDLVILDPGLPDVDGYGILEGM
jgi:DNA-binding response OmpR family regulator